MLQQSRELPRCCCCPAELPARLLLGIKLLLLLTRCAEPHSLDVLCNHCYITTFEKTTAGLFKACPPRPGPQRAAARSRVPDPTAEMQQQQEKHKHRQTQSSTSSAQSRRHDCVTSTIGTSTCKCLPLMVCAHCTQRGVENVCVLPLPAACSECVLQPPT